MAVARATALLLALLPGVASLLTSAGSQSGAAKKEVAGNSSYTTDDGSQCVDGPRRAVEANLATNKAKPSGRMYVLAKAEPGTSCQERGYKVDMHADACDPNVQLWLRNEEDTVKVQRSRDALLMDFREKYLVDEATGVFMEGCTCHPSSYVRKTLEGLGKCTELSTSAYGAWVHRSDFDGKPLTCMEGPFEYAVRSLAVLKSSAMLPMHLDDQIAADRCFNLGFGEILNRTDTCFPQMMFFSRRFAGHDKDNQEKDKIMTRLWSENTFKSWAILRSLDVEAFGTSYGCSCSPSSQDGQSLASYCQGEAGRSPVRDYWLD